MKQLSEVGEQKKGHVPTSLSKSLELGHNIDNGGSTNHLATFHPLQLRWLHP